MLTWNKPKTLENTLKSYKKLGLLDIIDNKIILCQQNITEEINIAKKYNFEILTVEKNIGIGKGINRLIKNVKTDYFIFLENDWELVSSCFKKEIIEQIENINDSLIDVYRLRNRKKPGYPLWSMISLKDKELEQIRGHPNLLNCVHWIDNPDIKLSEYIKK